MTEHDYKTGDVVRLRKVASHRYEVLDVFCAGRVRCVKVRVVKVLGTGPSFPSSWQFRAEAVELVSIVNLLGELAE